MKVRFAVLSAVAGSLLLVMATALYYTAQIPKADEGYQQIGCDNLFGDPREREQPIIPPPTNYYITSGVYMKSEEVGAGIYISYNPNKSYVLYVSPNALETNLRGYSISTEIYNFLQSKARKYDMLQLISTGDETTVQCIKIVGRYLPPAPSPTPVPPQVSTRSNVNVPPQPAPIPPPPPPAPVATTEPQSGGQTFVIPTQAPAIKKSNPNPPPALPNPGTASERINIFEPTNPSPQAVAQSNQETETTSSEDTTEAETALSPGDNPNLVKKGFIAAGVFSFILLAVIIFATTRLGKF